MVFAADAAAGMSPGQVRSASAVGEGVTGFRVVSPWILGFVLGVVDGETDGYFVRLNEGCSDIVCSEGVGVGYGDGKKMVGGIGWIGEPVGAVVGITPEGRFVSEGWVDTVGLEVNIGFRVVSRFPVGAGVDGAGDAVGKQASGTRMQMRGTLTEGA